MTIATVITGGFGSFGAIKYVITDGYGFAGSVATQTIIGTTYGEITTVSSEQLFTINSVLRLNLNTGAIYYTLNNILVLEL